MLDGLLSAAAVELYLSLLSTGTAGYDPSGIVDQSALQELLHSGFLREGPLGEARVIPVEPARAVEGAVFALQQKIVKEQNSIIQAHNDLTILQDSYRRSTVGLVATDHNDITSSIQVLTNPEETRALSAEFVIASTSEVLSFETAHFHLPTSPKAPIVAPPSTARLGIQMRCIYDREALELPNYQQIVDICEKNGWESRVSSGVPMKMLIRDRTMALVPLTPTGQEGALLIRAAVIVESLCLLFELLWKCAAPLTGNPADNSQSNSHLSPVQRRVLQLMAAGLTDGTIARQLRISERTVRRHVSAVQLLLGVDNRVAAAATAVRQQWIA
jgi:DNA-binding CsgD family transcriptional regulator